MKLVLWRVGLGLAIGVASVAGGRDTFPTWYLITIVAPTVPATWSRGLTLFRRPRTWQRCPPYA